MSNFNEISHPLIRFQNTTLTRDNGDILFRDLNWTIGENEVWALVGASGSGKTTLAESLLGRHRVISGILDWPILSKLRSWGQDVQWPSEIVGWVSFKEESRLFSYRDLYYQQRFEFADEANAPTVETFLKSGLEVEDSKVLSVSQRMGIDQILNVSFIKLSNGQTRRTRIARALLRNPELLILDDPFAGLDDQGRQDLIDILASFSTMGHRLLIITRPELIPPWVTHCLELDRFQVKSMGPTGNIAQRVKGNLLSDSRRREQIVPNQEDQSAKIIVELRDVSVVHQEKYLLKEVSWTIREGERWALIGPNGSGKSTLLSLLCGDHPQAYCNSVCLFGRQRGSGESIWEVKKRIGLLSPEIHLYFSGQLSAFEAALTGFFDVFTRRPNTEEQREKVRTLFNYFGIIQLGDRPFQRLSTGEQRLVLLVRALVKDPPLLLLDEPFQGLDPQSIEKARNYLDHHLLEHQALVFVTHIKTEIPETVNRLIRLRAGVIVEHF